jgi:hypothetical protein
MQFLNPAILFGLFAASIPLILHLINLRRNKQVEFSSNRFLEELKKSNIRNVKIRNLILLILRMLIIGCIIFAFSRPVVESDLALTGDLQPSSNIIILDNSYSMELPTGKGDALSTAKNKAKDILDALPPQSEAVVLSADAFNTAQFASDKSILYDDIDRTALSKGVLNTDLIDNSIERLFDKASYASRNIFLLSDNQTINKPLGTVNTLFNYDLSGRLPKDINNLAIDSIILDTDLIIPNGEVNVSVFISNTGNTSETGRTVQLSLDEQISGNQTFDIEPGQSIAVTFQVTVPSSGLISLSAELEKDMIHNDNINYLSFSAPPFPRIAVLGTNDSWQYLQSLLASIPDADVSYLTNTTFNSEDISGYGLLVITSGAFDSNTLNLAREYIGQGIPALIFAPTETSDRFSNFISSLGFVSPTWNDIDEDISSVVIDDNHPSLANIYSEKTGSIQDLSISKILAVSGGDSYVRAGGYPLFTSYSDREQNLRSIFVGVSSDMAYSDFPVTKIFAPYIYRSILYLSGIEPNPNVFSVDSKLILEVPLSYDILNVTDDNEVSISLPVTSYGSTGYIEIDKIDEVGNYTVYDNSDNVVTTFTVTHNPIESELDFSSEDFPENYTIIDSETNISDYLSGVAGQKEIWQIFIILAILLAITEMIIGNMKYR